MISYFSYSQIWLDLPVDDRHFAYNTKIAKKNTAASGRLFLLRRKLCSQNEAVRGGYDGHGKWAIAKDSGAWFF